MSTLAQTFGDVYFRSPVTVGAGPLTGRFDLLKRASDAGAGAVSIKQTPFSQPRPGVRKMYAERGGYFFNPSDTRLDYNITQDMVKRIKDCTDMAVLVNILGDGADTETWCFLADLMKKAGADGVELNFACPNPPGSLSKDEQGFQYGASMSKYPELCRKVIESIVEETGISVWPKFSGDGTDIPELSRAAWAAGARGVTAFSSPKGVFPIDIYNGGKPKMAALEKCSFGGINGPSIRPASLRAVAEAKKAAPSLCVIGGGGVEKPEHAIEYMMFGADLVFIHTKIMLDGFDIISRFNDEILKFMDNEGYDSISDINSLALKYEVSPGELDYRMGPAAKIDKEKCVGCGTCEKIGFCRSIEIKENKAQVNEKLCECCGLCASLCPKKAIYF